MNKHTTTLLALGLILTVTLLPFYALQKNVQADTASDLSQKISEKNNQIEQLEQEIKQYQTELNVIGKNAQTLKSSLTELDISHKKLEAEVKVTQSKITTTNLHIQELELQIGDKNQTIDNNQQSIAKGIAIINESENNPFIFSILTKSAITDSLRDIENIKSVQKRIRDNISEVTVVKTGLEGSRSDAIKAKSLLVELQSELGDQQKILSQNIVAKNKLLGETKDKESNYKKIVAQKTALKNAFGNELRNYEAQLKFVLDPSSLPKVGSGALNWPLQSVYITQLFGKTVAAKRLYTSGSHSGIDFRASTGTPVMAMASGTVLGFGDTDEACKGASFGKWVYIKYDNGLGSVYGHLSLIKASTGQRVAPGDIVAYSGFTGHATGPHLHVGLYAAEAVEISNKESIACKGKLLYQPRAALNAYLDPILYMPKYTADMLKPDMY